MSEFQSNPNQPYQPGPPPHEQPGPGEQPVPGYPYPPQGVQHGWASQYPPPPPGPPKKGLPWWAFVLGGCGCLVLLVPIIGAILFPVFSQARMAARATSCMSNEKQMALGVLMYCQDYDETLPAAKEWMTVIRPYEEGSENKGKAEYVFHCPEVSKRDPEIFGYAYNSDLNRKTLDKVGSPQTTLMLYDSSTLTANASDALTSLPSPGRHRREQNQGAFADGHTARLSGTLQSYTSGGSGSE
jgi:hypothetical protein